MTEEALNNKGIHHSAVGYMAKGHTQSREGFREFLRTGSRWAPKGQVFRSTLESNPPPPAPQPVQQQDRKAAPSSRSC